MFKLVFPTILLSCFSAIVLADLPPYTGPYGVGTIDLEIPLEQPQIVGTSLLKNGSRAAFKLDTVRFTIYYPASKDAQSTKQTHQWLPEPRSLIAQGLSGASGGSVSPDLIQLGFDIYTRNLTIPAQVDVPLQNDTEKYPVLLFSHGQPTIAGWYSQLFGEVVSRGVVVVSATHRDGSSPATVVRFKNGTSYNVTAFTEADVSPSLSPDDFHAQQLDMRQAEWNEIGTIISSINNGSGTSIYNASSLTEGSSLAGFTDRLDLTRVIVAGHSFGGNTVLRYLSSPSATLPAKAALIFDPGKDSGPLPSPNQTVPLLIVQSQEWSAVSKTFYGTTHFAAVKAIAERAVQGADGAGWFMTLAGTVHASVTDVGIIAPSFVTFFTNNTDMLTLSARAAVAAYVNVTTDFVKYVQGKGVGGVLSGEAKYPSWQNVTNATLLSGGPWEIHVGTSKAKTSDANRYVGSMTCLVMLLVFGLFVS